MIAVTIDVAWERLDCVRVDGVPAIPRIVPGTMGHVDYVCPHTGERLPGALSPGRFLWQPGTQTLTPA